MLLRKVIIMLCLVSVLVAMAVPSFASIYEETITKANPVIQFDEMSFESLVEDIPVNWYGDCPLGGGYDEQGVNYYDRLTDYDDIFRSATDVYSVSGGYEIKNEIIFDISDELDDGMAQRLTFWGGTQVIKLSDLVSKQCWFDNPDNVIDVYWEYVYLRGNIVDIQESASGNYVSVQRPFEVRVFRSVQNGVYAYHFGNELYKKFKEMNVNQNYVLVNDIRLVIDCRKITDDTLDIGFRMGSTSSGQVYDATVAQWFTQYNLPREMNVSGGGIGQFISSTVNGFFNFELFPGFSFGNILTFVMGIALLLWFIKLIK